MVGTVRLEESGVGMAGCPSMTDTQERPGQHALLHLAAVAKLLILTQTVHTLSLRPKGTWCENDTLGRLGQ